MTNYTRAKQIADKLSEDHSGERRGLAAVTFALLAVADALAPKTISVTTSEGTMTRPAGPAGMAQSWCPQHGPHEGHEWRLPYSKHVLWCPGGD